MPQLVQVFEKVAAGLVHMHRRSVCHADLKPNNIMLSRAGDVKIIDYGLAWIKGEPKDRVQGTPEYMAPETGQAQVVNERTDIYNFGATMYRLVDLAPAAAAIVGAGRRPADRRQDVGSACSSRSRSSTAGRPAGAVRPDPALPGVQRPTNGPSA